MGGGEWEAKSGREDGEVGEGKGRGKEAKSRWEVGEEWHNTGYEHTVEIPFYFSPYPPSSPPPLTPLSPPFSANLNNL